MKNNYETFPQSGRNRKEKDRKLLFLFCLLGISLIACGAFQNPDKEMNLDLSPPVFMNLITTSEQTILLTFNEPTSMVASHVSFQPELLLKEITKSGQEIHLSVSPQIPGTEYTLTSTCLDDNGNSLQFMVTFYGFNPHIPRLIINEFITQGSTTHPDLIEIKVIEGGNMGGIVCYQGTHSNWDDRLIFPAFPVRKDDFILVHFKPQGIASEINETESRDSSEGLDASAHAFDFWIREGTGISGNNGVLSLYDRPGGTILDGVLYSNRTSESDDKYGGFGTKKVMERAMELAGAKGWIPGNTNIRPEDGINPDDSTATRSLCRKINETDTHTNRDWHIVPTGKSSFGEENCEEIYTK